MATSGEVLVSVDDGKANARPWFEETPREWVEGIWPEQVWAPPGDVCSVLQRRHRLRERRDVADYRHTLSCIRGRDAGRTPAELAAELGRPEDWVHDVLRHKPPQKPKNLEHWNTDGFCEVRYVKRRYHEVGLYETIVQGVDWQQDKVWRVHKELNGDWGLRTVKQCESGGCGRSLLRVPDSSVKIGPGDASAPRATRPHDNWQCRKQFDGCLKRSFETPVGDRYYWWCPAHKWYVCQECQQAMPDKPTSKQIRGWHRGECPALDALVYRIVEDFNLPDPCAQYGGTARYTIKMNWYPDGLAQVTDHRHDVWTILVSLGSARVLNVDYARLLMEDGDAILFGTQKHGVPPAPPSQGGRLSLVLMFAPDVQIEKAALSLAGHFVPGFVPRAPQPPEESWSGEEWDEGEDGGGDLGWEAQGASATEGHLNEDDVASLCALGFARRDALQALEVCSGSATAAANLLLGV